MRLSHGPSPGSVADAIVSSSWASKALPIFRFFRPGRCQTAPGMRDRHPPRPRRDNRPLEFRPRGVPGRRRDRQQAGALEQTVDDFKCWAVESGASLDAVRARRPRSVFCSPAQTGGRCGGGGLQAWTAGAGEEGGACEAPSPDRPRRRGGRRPGRPRRAARGTRALARPRRREQRELRRVLPMHDSASTCSSGAGSGRARAGAPHAASRQQDGAPCILRGGGILEEVRDLLRARGVALSS